MTAAPEVVTDLETLVKCPDCPRTFKSAAGAGRHRTSVHGMTLSGKRVTKKKRRVRAQNTKSKPVSVSFEMDQGTIRIEVSPADARTFLMDHPQETLESLLGG